MFWREKYQYIMVLISRKIILNRYRGTSGEIIIIDLLVEVKQIFLVPSLLRWNADSNIKDGDSIFGV